MTPDGRTLYRCADLADFGALLDRAAEVRLVIHERASGARMASLILWDDIPDLDGTPHLWSGACWDIGWA